MGTPKLPKPRALNPAASQPQVSQGDAITYCIKVPAIGEVCRAGRPAAGGRHGGGGIVLSMTNLSTGRIRTYSIHGNWKVYV